MLLKKCGAASNDKMLKSLIFLSKSAFHILQKEKANIKHSFSTFTRQILLKMRCTPLYSHLFTTCALTAISLCKLKAKVNIMNANKHQNEMLYCYFLLPLKQMSIT